jgi:aubergine-like protein
MLFLPNDVGDLELQSSLSIPLKEKDKAGDSHTDPHATSSSVSSPEAASSMRGTEGTVIPVTISITKTNEIPPGSQAPLQLYNMMFRKVLRLLKLKQIGRHYFDPHRPITIPQHRVELWPGYFTAVNPNQRGTVLVADVTHKVLRMDTVLDFITEVQQSYPQYWKEIAIKQLTGQIVLTRYNNRTYRIDDIQWDMSPNRYE